MARLTALFVILLVPANAVAATHSSGATPTHVRYGTYYGQNGTYALDVPAAWMASHVDFVQGNAKQCAAFHAAGGFKCGIYLRATLQAKCPAGGGYGQCDDDLGTSLPESAWYHSAGPGSPRTYTCGNGLCYNEANPGDPAVRAAFQKKTAQLKAQGFDYVFCDDTTALSFPRTAGIWWNFSSTPYEITSGQPESAQSNKAFNAKWQRELAGLFNAGALPCWTNSGAGPYFVSARDFNVIGVGQEAGFVDPEHGRMGIGSQGGGLTWDAAENNLLAAIQQGRGKYVLVMPEGSSSDESTVLTERIYALASFWISYDPKASVMESFFKSPPDAGGRPVLVYPEYQIVPAKPLQTAHAANIMQSTLCVTTAGPCFREFADCYQSVDNRNGIPSRPKRIGRCAAVINVSDREVDMPALAKKYSASLVIDMNSTWGGGTARWTGAVPSTLPPLSAYVLRG